MLEELPNVAELPSWPAPVVEGRKSIHGTATWRPPKLELVIELPLVLVLALVFGVEVLSDPVVPEVFPWTFKMANATRPEDGLMITSWMLPSCWPDELVTREFVIWLKRTCC